MINMSHHHIWRAIAAFDFGRPGACRARCVRPMPWPSRMTIIPNNVAISYAVKLSRMGIDIKIDFERCSNHIFDDTESPASR